MAKSAALDTFLAGAVEDTMAEIGGSGKLIGDLGEMFADIRKAVDSAKLGIAAAGSELMTEVDGLKHIETAIRTETESVRQFKTKLLGNATGGENSQ